MVYLWNTFVEHKIKNKIKQTILLSETFLFRIVYSVVILKCIIFLCHEMHC